MRFFTKILAALTLLTAVPALAKDPIRTFDSCTVTKIADGDTITAVCSGARIKVRLYGIDSPETEKRNSRTGVISKSGQPYGSEAERAIRGKILGQAVKVEVMDVDRYRRLVSLVWRDGRNINYEMVGEGWAWAYKQYLDRPYRSEFIEAEEQARSRRLGLWADPDPEPPWEFRVRIKSGR